MKARRYALEPGGPKRLEIRSKGSYRKVTVVFDDQVLAEDVPAKALKGGVSWTLPDGSRLEAKRVTNYSPATSSSSSATACPFRGAAQTR